MKLFLIMFIILIAGISQQTSADVILRTPNFKDEQYLSREAAFGPELHENGFWGYFVYVNPITACGSVSPPPNSQANSHWIALISRENCSFVEKVFNAQQVGYSAVIVHNVDSDRVMTMRGGSGSSGIRIPSVFIGHRSAKHLIPYSAFRNVTMGLIEDEDKDTFGYFLVPCAILIGIFGIVGSMVMMARCRLRRRRERQRPFIPTHKVKRLPIKKFKNGNAADICSVCLEDYEEGDRLRVLPCHHEYHQKCIDPWLMRNSRLCPLCKSRVFSSDESDTESVQNLLHALGADEVGDETTPLLFSGRPRRQRERRVATARRAQMSESRDQGNDQQRATAQVHSQPRPSLLSYFNPQSTYPTDQSASSMVQRSPRASSPVGVHAIMSNAENTEEGAIGGFPADYFQGANEIRRGEMRSLRSENVDRVGQGHYAANVCEDPVDYFQGPDESRRGEMRSLRSQNVDRVGQGYYGANVCDDPAYYFQGADESRRGEMRSLRSQNVDSVGQGHYAANVCEGPVDYFQGPDESRRGEMRSLKSQNGDRVEQGNYAANVCDDQFAPAAHEPAVSADATAGDCRDEVPANTEGLDETANTSQPRVKKSKGKRRNKTGSGSRLDDDDASNHVDC